MERTVLDQQNILQWETVFTLLRTYMSLVLTFTSSSHLGFSPRIFCRSALLHLGLELVSVVHVVWTHFCHLSARSQLFFMLLLPPLRRCFFYWQWPRVDLAAHEADVWTAKNTDVVFSSSSISSLYGFTYSSVTLAFDDICTQRLLFFGDFLFPLLPKEMLSLPGHCHYILKHGCSWDVSTLKDKIVLLQNGVCWPMMVLCWFGFGPCMCRCSANTHAVAALWWYFMGSLRYGNNP